MLYHRPFSLNAHASELNDEPIVIARKLWYDTKEQRVTLFQADLRGLTQPLVILAEAGMGKTNLLEWLADSPGYVSAQRVSL